MFKICIPKPCHENWDHMSPMSDGRFCSSCEKTVVDFTSMNDDKVKHYLLHTRSENLCGRVTSKQLNTVRLHLPADILHQNMPYWKRFLVGCLLVFSSTLFSCNVLFDGPVVGKIMPPVDTTVTQFTSGVIAVPVPESCNTFMGDIVATPANATDTIIPETITVGKIKIEPVIEDTLEVVKGEIKVYPVKDRLPVDTTLLKKTDTVVICNNNLNTGFQ